MGKANPGRSMETQQNSTERVAVVTGASQGVGLAVADHLAATGFLVWTVARRGDLLGQLAGRHADGRVIPAPTDLTCPADVERLVDTIRRRTPIIHALVHSAGTYSYGPLDELPTEQLRQNYAVNVESAYLLTQRLLDLMSDPADIVFLNSSQGLHAAATVSQFAASMHARKALADALRAEVNPRSVRVMSLFLGRTASPLQESIYKSHGWDYQPELLLQPTEIATMIASVISMPRTAEVTDMTMRPAIKSY